MNICTICGSTHHETGMIRRKLNGNNHYFCGVGCEVRWEKINLIGICG